MSSGTPRVDLRPDHWAIVDGLLRQHVPDRKVLVFGSRATWTAKDYSDLDLAILGEQPLSADATSALTEGFGESDLPFKVDLVDWARIDEFFRDIIRRDGVVVQIPGRRSVAAGPVRRPLPESRISGAQGEWRSINLGRVCTKIGSGATPRGGRDVYMSSGPYALIRSQNVFNDGFHHNGLAYIGERHASELAGVEVQARDVLLNITGDSVARACMVDSRVLPARVNQHVAIIRPDPDKLDPGFLRYFLISPKTQSRLLSWAGGGGTRNALTKGMIETFDVPAPRDVGEQRAISHILGTLDNKIELNRRMDVTLEATARALFKSWFVDFDPVRAKIEGRDTGLPKDTADLFPDQLVDSELGEIPKGWLVETLGKHFEAVKGVSYKGSGLSGDGVPLHNLNSIFEGGGYKYEGIKFYTGDHKERHRVRPGDVIVANTEQGHDRLLIGFAAIVPGAFGTNGIASHHVYRLRSRRVSWLSTRFVLFLLNSGRMHDIVSGYANGTTVNMLPIDGVQRPLFAVPPRALVETFDRVVSCSEDRREQTVHESWILAVVRDTLLPRLVSGEVRVNEVEPPPCPTDSLAPVGATTA